MSNAWQKISAKAVRKRFKAYMTDIPEINEELLISEEEERALAQYEADLATVLYQESGGDDSGYGRDDFGDDASIPDLLCYEIY